jgi:hypothetical protein
VLVKNGTDVVLWAFVDLPPSGRAGAPTKDAASTPSVRAFSPSDLPRTPSGQPSPHAPAPGSGHDREPSRWVVLGLRGGDIPGSGKATDFGVAAGAAGLSSGLQLRVLWLGSGTAYQTRYDLL